VLAALQEHWCEYLLSLFCLFTLCIASVNALQTVFSNSSYEITAIWETIQILKEERLLVHICNQNGHFIRCIHSSSFQGYDSIHKS